MAGAFPKKFKMSKISPYVVDYCHIYIYFQFHANPTAGFETKMLNKN